MNFKALLLISASLIPFSTLAFESIDTTNLHPTWKKIQNLNNPHVLFIARFAVKQHNMEAGTNLEFLDVVNGHIRVDNGVNSCDLLLRATNNLDNNNTITYYQTLVQEQYTKQHKNLIYFVKAHSVIDIDEYEI